MTNGIEITHLRGHAQKRRPTRLTQAIREEAVTKTVVNTKLYTTGLKVLYFNIKMYTNTVVAKHCGRRERP